MNELVLSDLLDVIPLVKAAQLFFVLVKSHSQISVSWLFHKNYFTDLRKF